MPLLLIHTARPPLREQRLFDAVPYQSFAGARAIQMTLYGLAFPVIGAGLFNKSRLERLPLYPHAEAPNPGQPPCPLLLLLCCLN